MTTQPTKDLTLSFANSMSACTLRRDIRSPLPHTHKETRMNQSQIIALALACVSGLAVEPSVARDNDHEVPLSAVVKRAPGVGYGVVNNALEPYCRAIHFSGSAFGDSVRLVSYELQGQSTERQVHDAIQGLVAQGSLMFGEANFNAHEVDGQTGSVWVTDLGATTLAYNNQYAFGRLGFDSAHTRSRGAGVVVAIIDSGVDPSHEAVDGPLTAWQWDFVENDAFPLDAGDGIDNDDDGVIDDGVGHGTYVTSLIRLAAPEARLMHLRVLDDEGSSDSFGLSSAIHSAIDHGAHIINVSVSTTFDSSMLEDALARARAAGIIVVAAMGNEGLPIPTVMEYPAASSLSFAVCATNHLDLKGSFSNFGACADFSACGVSFVPTSGVPNISTSILGAVPGAGYAHWSGTSLSAAFLTGAVAVVRAQYPAWPNEAVPAVEVPGMVMDLLALTSEPIDSINPEFAGMMGIGRINVGGAVLLGPRAPQLADLDGNGRVDGGDLAMMLGAWGACAVSECDADFDGNGMVDGSDLATIMASWG